MSEEQAISCWRCKTVYSIPLPLYIAAKASEAISFFCPFGHAAHFPLGESDETKLRRERDRLTQRLAEKDDEIARQRARVEATERRLSASRGQVTKIKNRVGNGVCPCCTRNFGNLAAHMKHKHPDYSKDQQEATS